MRVVKNNDFVKLEKKTLSANTCSMDKILPKKMTQTCSLHTSDIEQLMYVVLLEDIYIYKINGCNMTEHIKGIKTGLTF